MINSASRISHVEEYYFSKKLKEVDALNKNGKGIINLGIGSPDLPPHESVIAALNKAAQVIENHGYQSYRGLPELREAFANWYQKYFKVKLNPESELLPLMGSKEGILHISMAYLESGDEVLVPNPGYPAYSATAKLAGAEIRYYDLKEDENWQPDLNELAKTDLSKVKLMWVNYPHMPTGAKADNELFKKLNTFAQQHNILVCHDNPYSFILNEKPESILKNGLNDNVIELNSLSKSHNMAGWRIGVIAAKEHHINNILKFKSNMDSGMFKPIQLAALEALNLPDDWYQQQNALYRERKEIAFNILNSLDCSYQPEQSGMFAWGKIPEYITSVENFTDEILYQAQVFIVPGTVFGSNGSRYVRISLCADKEKLNKALERIIKFKQKK
jgi:aspartate/methionine/tyrosine aminotransferase